MVNLISMLLMSQRTITPWRLGQFFCLQIQQSSLSKGLKVDINIFSLFSSK